MMFLTFVSFFGMDTLFTGHFRWEGFFLSLLLLTLAFECLMLEFAVISMALGKIAALFVGGFSLLFFNAWGLWLRMGVGLNQENEVTYWRKIVGLLPPVGEIFYRMKRIFFDQEWAVEIQLWLVWIAIFTVLFRLLIHHPARNVSGES